MSVARDVDARRAPTVAELGPLRKSFDAAEGLEMHERLQEMALGSLITMSRFDATYRRTAFHAVDRRAARFRAGIYKRRDLLLDSAIPRVVPGLTHQILVQELDSALRLRKLALPHTLHARVDRLLAFLAR
jgi:hypothetical protein